MKSKKNISIRLSNNTALEPFDVNDNKISFSNRKKRVQSEEEITLRDLLEKDVPNWYRGTSNFQFQASKELFNALRDDAEQESTHRVRACLEIIGLKPMITSKEIKLLMRLSQCNDLAFLWFLMENHYKTPGDDYSINERLILSSIFNLDLITTLRELDRILPPGQPPKEKTFKKTCPPIKRTQYKPKYIYPYFEVQRRPCKYGKPLTARMPDFKIHLPHFALYKNPKYIVQNEINRWYEFYKLQPTKRIVKNILDSEIGNVLNGFGRNWLGSEEQLVICEHHRTQKETEEQLANELRVIARDRCVQLLDVTKKDREACHTRVMEQLDDEIKLYMCKFRKFMDGTQNLLPVKLIKGGACHQCMLEDCDESCDKMKCKGIQQSRCRNSGTRPELQSNLCPYILECRDNNRSSEDEKCPKPHFRDVDEPENRIDNFCCNKHKQMGLDYHNFGDTQDLVTPTTSQQFFQPPTEHTPYQFDYRKIFNSGKHDELDIKKTFIKAVDSTAENDRRTGSFVLSLHKTCSNAFKKIWTEMVTAKIKEMAEEERIRLKLEQECPLIYPPGDYDPNDKELMHKMLKDALCHMRQNPKFVLASLPDVHKLPVLREWIYQRYGKSYTQLSRFHNFRKSMKIFNLLNECTSKVPYPTMKEIGTNIYMDYTCRKYLKEKGEALKSSFREDLNESVLSQVRCLWFAIQPYFWSLGPPRHTYYAYMPARGTDIINFRLWKKNECMDAKKIWDKRIAESYRRKY